MKRSRWYTCVLTLALLSACGGGGGGGGSGIAGVQSALCAQGGALPPELMAVYNETQQCTRLQGPPPEVVFSPTVECPSGRRRCLATVEFSPCSNDPSRMCGAGGRYLSGCQTIELPNEWHGAAAHEMVHHLLYVNGRSDWNSETAPELACQ